MLVIDLLHKVELGVWKAVFIHLLWLLDCVNESLKHELERQYMQINILDIAGLVTNPYQL